MGKQLYDIEPVFRESIDECAELLRPYLDIPLPAIIWGDSADAFAQDTRYTQPVLFAVEWALFKLWRSWGVTPTVVLGHSVGEYAASCAAGVYSLSDGLRFIAARGRLAGSLPQKEGSMAAVLAPREIVERAVARWSPGSRSRHITGLRT